MGGSKTDWRKRCFHLLDRVDLYKFIFNEMGEMVVYLYPDGRFGCVNDKYRESSGLGRGDTPERAVYDCIVPENCDEFRAAVASLSKSSPVTTGEMRGRHASGEVRWQRWTHRACFDAQGILASYFSIVQDLPPQKAQTS